MFVVWYESAYFEQAFSATSDKLFLRCILGIPKSRLESTGSTSSKSGTPSFKHELP